MTRAGRRRTWASCLFSKRSGPGPTCQYRRPCSRRSALAATTRSWVWNCWLCRWASAPSSKNCAGEGSWFTATIAGQRCALCSYCLHLIIVSAAQVAIRRGSAKSWDHAQLVHTQWLHAARWGMHLFIKRVATDDNIADLPSRKAPAPLCSFSRASQSVSHVQAFELLRERGMREVPPCLDNVFADVGAWDELKERWSQ